MENLKLLDLFCGAGGAAKGYADAGFIVTGVDIKKQKHYPYEFFQEDAFNFILEHADEYDVIHASPPCQFYSIARNIHKNIIYDDLVELVRKVLIETGKPYIIENVIGAPLINPVMLCGTMFNLKVYRHRLFESNIPLEQLPHFPHLDKTPRRNGDISEKGYITVAGHFHNKEYAEQAMGIAWMSRNELAQAIPPAYTKYIGEQILWHLKKKLLNSTTSCYSKYLDTRFCVENLLIT